MSTATATTTPVLSPAVAPAPSCDTASAEKVRRIRRQLALGIYDLESRLDEALDRMIDQEFDGR